MSSSDKKTEKKSKPLTPEEIIAGFNQLRNEQRSMATSLSDFELEVNEHNMVIETLKNVDAERKCHQLIGGVLVERQVKDVLPAIRTNKEFVEGLIKNLKDLLTKKGEELIEYKTKHSIKIRGQDDLKQEVPAVASEESARGNVLVS